MSLQVLLVTFTIISMAGLSDAQCTFPPNQRRDCGFSGINQQMCLSKGCCYDSSIRGVIWCFHPLPPTTTETRRTTSVPSQNGTTTTSHDFNIGLAEEPVTRVPPVNATQQTTQNTTPQTTQNTTPQTTQNTTPQTTQNTTLQTNQNTTLQTNQNTTLQTNQNTTMRSPQKTTLRTAQKTTLKTTQKTTNLFSSCGTFCSWSHLSYICLISLSILAFSGY
ncbi:integumentary mucin A.1-like [Hyla sarda]|uniref:integumentary mucin A.1-like n=1 Tax=Hyla sarda TaxID=327740 RepID=UPI0024C28F5C|nr:integumentary mucin A.1-like [Hyla sarda]